MTYAWTCPTVVEIVAWSKEKTIRKCNEYVNVICFKFVYSSVPDVKVLQEISDGKHINLSTDQTIETTDMQIPIPISNHMWKHFLHMIIHRRLIWRPQDLVDFITFEYPDKQSFTMATSTTAFTFFNRVYNVFTDEFYIFAFIFSLYFYNRNYQFLLLSFLCFVSLKCLTILYGLSSLSSLSKHINRVGVAVN